jgi:hypothetical protein
MKKKESLYEPVHQFQSIFHFPAVLKFMAVSLALNKCVNHFIEKFGITSGSFH